MQARMKNPAMLVPGAMEALQTLNKALENSGVSPKILGLVHMRASQINGCSVCIDMHARMMKQSGESEERMFTVAAWRDAPYFSSEERAALELTECITRLSDRADPVPDEVWNEATKYFGEHELAVLTLSIAAINVWNRLNVATKQVAGEWAKSAEAKRWVEASARSK